MKRSLALLAPEPDQFKELERVKQIALDCARTVLGTTGGKVLRIIPHHSKEVWRLKARLTLLKVVRREIRSRKEQGRGLALPSRAMRRVWDSGLWPQPATFSIPSALWTPQNHSWTDYWLRMLRQQSATVTEEWHCLRRRELTEAAERDRMGAISRFYTGRELQRLLHQKAPAPH